MTEEKFTHLKELKKKIEDSEYKIRQIDLLISSCGLGCKITGTANNRKLITEHNFYNKNKIIEILNFDRERISIELVELKKEFSEL